MKASAWRNGFTLVEVLLVVTILGILSTITVVAVVRHMDKTREGATRATMGAVKTALNAYYMDTGSYAAGLIGLVEDDGNKGWKGPYVEKMPVDGWGEPFRYQVLSADKYELRSGGRDMQMNTGDDLLP